MRGLYLLAAVSCLLAEAQDARRAEPIKRTTVQYSDEARVAGLEGTVRFTAVINPDGSPRDVKIVQPLGLGLDEKALEAVRTWRFRSDPGNWVTSLAVDFLLPSRQSHWHLTSVVFEPPEGASRPVFLSVKYPLGSGITLELGETAIDEARIVAAAGRQAWAVVSFEVDENGLPGQFDVPSVSADVWKNQAIAVVREWRFKPGMKNGKPVAVRGTLNLVWGERDLSTAKLVNARPPDPKPEAPAPVLFSAFPPPVPGVARVALSNDTQSRQLLQKVTPEPSPFGQLSGPDTTVNVSVLIGADGHVREAFPLSGAPLLMGAAIEAVKQWVYRPTLINGYPAEVVTVVPLGVK